jgi:DNA-binding response OmpR family regulator
MTDHAAIQRLEAERDSPAALRSTQRAETAKEEDAPGGGVAYSSTADGGRRRTGTAMSGALERVRTCVVDADDKARAATIDHLKAAGFADIQGFGNVEPLYAIAGEGALDLVLIESAAGDPTAARFLRALRHQELGDNPFPIAIATTITASVDHIRALIDAGYDDIVRRPVSFDALLKRTLAFVESRKQFVVTTDYLGPDRRSGGRKTDGEEIPLIDVPNPVNLIAKRNLSYEDVRSLATESFSNLNRRKIERHVIQIQWLVDRILPKFLYDAIDDECSDMLLKLHGVGEDLRRRVADSDAAHLEEFAVQLVNVANRIASDPADANPSDISQLPQLAKTLSSKVGGRRKRS